MTVQLAPATGPRGRVVRYLAPLAVAIAAAAAIAVVVSGPGQSGQRARRESHMQSPAGRLRTGSASGRHVHPDRGQDRRERRSAAGVQSSNTAARSMRGGSR